jgi:hypothetical protein
MYTRALKFQNFLVGSDMQGWTCLHQAAYYASQPIVERLLEAGADPSATTADGSTPASLARQNPQTPPPVATGISHLLGAAALGREGAEFVQVSHDHQARDAHDAGDAGKNWEHGGIGKLGDESDIMKAAFAKVHEFSKGPLHCDLSRHSQHCHLSLVQTQ